MIMNENYETIISSDDLKKDYNNRNESISYKRLKTELEEIVKEKIGRKIEKEKLLDIKYINNILSKEKPEIVENIEIKEYIDSGSESRVYKSMVKNNKKFVAMKLILRNNKKINKHEIDISRKLKNKNIINFYGYSEIVKNELDCMIIEYGKFGNLRYFQKKLLKKYCLSESFLCYIAYQILNGLKYCHTHKVAHLDLKPQNIIIDEHLNVKIIDFSISMDYSKIKKSQIQLPKRGTSFYIAPEIFSSQKIDIKDINKVDLYSLGILLYNLAFNSYPYDLSYDDMDDYNKIYKKINNNNLIIKKNKYYSPQFNDFLSKLLQKDINKRININEAMNDYWIKGANILFEEKDKIWNCNNFLIYLCSDSFKNFNDYIHKKNKS